jgi:ferrous iron transport protein B
VPKPQSPIPHPVPDANRATAAQPPKPRIALMGNPNTGKTSVFNLLTGARRRVGNYPGVTVDRVSGDAGHDGFTCAVIDLPGAYSLIAHSPDERIAIDTLRGTQSGEPPIDAVVVVVDCDNLERNLFLASQVLELGLPTVIAANMVDVVARRGRRIDFAALSRTLGAPVIPVNGRSGQGRGELIQAMRAVAGGDRSEPRPAEHPNDSEARYAWCTEIAQACIRQLPGRLANRRSERLDDWLTHRVFGTLLFAIIMGTVFLSVFSWAAPLMDAIDGAFGALAGYVHTHVEGPMLASFLADGVVTGVGGVLVFLPQILILIALITVLEDCGYLARAAFLMDRLMRLMGLGGRSFVPLLSSFACAIPGIMAARTIASPRERLITVLVAPLIPCSARIPVYTLFVLAFVPARTVLGFIPVQGLVFCLVYAFGVVVAGAAALVLKRTLLRDTTDGPFLLELPSYKMPSLRTILLRLYDRTRSFVTTAGTIILAMSIIIWALGYFPRPASLADEVRTELAAEGVTEASEIERAISGTYLRQSYLARMGQWIEPVVKPLGWDWRIGTAVLAAFPAREVVVATIGIIYNLGPDTVEDSKSLHRRLRSATWPDGRKVFTVPVALSVMVFFALCCQCQATVAVIKRETKSWGWAGFAFGYMTVLAYVAALAVYQIGQRLA